MFSELAFFSFVRLTDPTQHRAYNEWHQLDHRPENLALPGVAWGDRWARRGDCAENSRAQGPLVDVDYMAMYWFRPPVSDAVAAWDALGEASFQWGRGPLIPGVERAMLAFFRPVKGYAAPRALVSSDVLPYRPNKGLHVRVTHFDEPHSLDAHDVFQREDRELIPDMLELDGVAGAWTFSFSHSQRHSSLPLNGDDAYRPGSIRIRLAYLDDEPVAVAAEIERLQREMGESPVERELLSSAVTTIIPWQDW
ncbi:hypothetical protein [Microcella pacifica]|uniref:Uncharacterized protein n=1 Tax=Microcella pacifica TaxID=2591847 RepID=A0A9E5JNK6_9MICO|nr:hypothetical protein [Microcella pacifica]NHF62171.1 hypothetical protein [Microcella pacifica]